MVQVRDFDHFNGIYDLICECIRTPEDVELVTRDFLVEQAAQNIRYSEVTYTPSRGRMPFTEQLAAINRARAWAQETLGVAMGIILDIPREVEPEEGMSVAEWAISGMGKGVVALGLAGPEQANPPEKFAAAFARAHAAGLPCVPHAGETAGPESIWQALDITKPARIGHGARCLEDPRLVAELRERQIPLDVCPTSNIRLGIFESIAIHPVRRLMDAGLYVTLNSDDPPMFNTTLTDEYTLVAETFALTVKEIEQLALNATRATLLPKEERAQLEAELDNGGRRTMDDGRWITDDG